MSSFDKRRKKWVARVMRNNKREELGTFDTKDEADNAERTAKINNPKGRNRFAKNFVMRNGKYRSQFWENGKLISHGTFDKEEDVRMVNELIKETKQFQRPKGTPSSRNTSGHIGVNYQKKWNKWIARYKNKHLGLFDTIEEAITARKAAEDADV
jgi:hypothetical protein